MGVTESAALDLEPLVDALVARGASLGDRAAIARALGLAVDRGLRAWPRLGLDAAALAAHLAATLGGGEGDALEALGAVHAEDVALAHAAGTGDERAMAIVEETYFGDVAPILARMAGSTAARDELVQRLRERLFLATPERAPGILGFAGRSDLRGFLRVAITRTALNLLSRAGRDVPSDDALFDALPDIGDDPEVRHVRERCQAEVRAAFRAGVAALSARERNLLRHAFLDGLGVDALGRVYGVHRATAARWLSAARGKLLAELTADLRRRLQIAPSEVESLLRWARSGIELTLEHCFESARL